MADQRHTHHTLRMNRAPVLTLWAAVVAAACAQDPTASEVCRVAPRFRPYWRATHGYPWSAPGGYASFAREANRPPLSPGA